MVHEIISSWRNAVLTFFFTWWFCGTIAFALVLARGMANGAENPSGMAVIVGTTLGLICASAAMIFT